VPLLGNQYKLEQSILIFRYVGGESKILGEENFAGVDKIMV